MIQSLSAIKRRMQGVKNVHKVTRAMEVVSAVKLSRMKSALLAYRKYFSGVNNIAGNVLAAIQDCGHPLLGKRDEVKRVAVCVISSDAGLCGIYNHAVLTSAEDFISRLGKDPALLVSVGKESTDYFRRREVAIKRQFNELRGRYRTEFALKIADYLISLFLNKEADEVYLVYARFQTTLRHTPVVEKLLNIEFPAAASGVRYIFEPDQGGFLNELIPRYIYGKVSSALLEAFTSEHSARMVAMKNATDNAEELMDGLTLLKNKMRQAGITREVIEIASAAEAIKE